MTTPRKVDFTTQTLNAETEQLDVKGCIAFEVENLGTSDLVIEGSVTMRRFDSRVFCPPIPGAEFIRNKKIQFSDASNASALLIIWKVAPENDPNNVCTP